MSRELVDSSWVEDYNQLIENYDNFSSKELDVIDSKMKIALTQINDSIVKFKKNKKNLIEWRSTVKLLKIAKG